MVRARKPPTRPSWTARGFVLALAIACSSDDETVLVVDVRTDIVPVLEFQSVRVVIDDQTAAFSVGAADDFVAGRRVAELTGLALGDKTMSVTLADASGAAVATRDVAFRLERDLGLTVVLSRRCRGIVCDRTGGPSTCHDGRCIPPECTTQTPAACGDPECAVDGDCAGSTGCSRGVCATGLCLSVADDMRCPSGETCNPDRGCQPSGVDGGVPDGSLGDAALPDAPGSDAGACDPTAFRTVRELVELSPYVPGWPELTDDGLGLYLAFGVTAMRGIDLYHASRSGIAAAFGPPMSLDAPSSDAEDADPTVSPDQLTIYFRSARSGDIDLYYATRPSSGEAFGAAIPVGMINTTGLESDPAISADELELFFVSSTGTGGDIYVATRGSTADRFDVRSRVGELSTPSAESGLYLTRDGTALYFSSDRPGGEGRRDIWVATRPRRGMPFGAAVNVRALNTTSDEDDPGLTADRRIIVFNRWESGVPLRVFTAESVCP